MIQDWNFWFSVITAFFAVIALFQTAHQTRLSNKQQLFDRRLKTFTIVQGLISLYKENQVQLEAKRDNDPQFANDLEFILLTNNTFMEQQAHAIEHPLESPYHQDFLRKREELREIAAEIPLIFSGSETEAYSKFVSCYEQLLFRMYQYEISLGNMKKVNEEHPMTMEQASNIAGEARLRDQLFSALDEIKEAYQVIDKKHIEDKIKKQITLV